MPRNVEDINTPVEDTDDDIGTQQSEFDAIVGAMGLDDGDSKPVDKKPAQTTSPPTPPPGSPPQRGQQAPAQQAQSPQVDQQTALHRLQQYETTLIPQLQRQHQQLSNELAQTKERYKSLEEYASTITQFGLKPDEAAIGLQMAATYKRSPAEFIRSLINTARANNVDLSSLNMGQAGAIDPQTYTQIVRNELKPILDRFKMEEEEERADREAQERYQQFIQTFPDALQHQNEIAQVMNGTGYDAVRSYYELRMWAQQNGFDWNQPLVPQMEARRGVNGNGNGQSQRNVQNFSGNRRSNNYNQPVKSQETEQFDVNVDWKSIVRSAVEGVSHGGG